MDLNKGKQEANAMEQQILSSVASVSAQQNGRVIDVREYAVGDGSDETVQITNFFNAAQDGDTLLFTPGHYRVVKSGWFYGFNGRKVTIVGLPGSVLEVSDQGIRLEYSNYIRVDGLTLKRTTQAPWGTAKTGMYVSNSNNVIIENCDISMFTDALGMNGSSIAGQYTRNAVIRNNRFHDLGEEPIAVRQGLEYVLITGNECYRHFGDAILIKATRNAVISNNYIHSGIKRSDPDFLTYSGGSTSSVLPYVGGGITCNNEGGESGAVAMYVHGNILRNVGYGVGLLGFYGAWITDNHLENILNAVGIGVAFAPSIYNPGDVTNHVFVIAGNIIDGLLRSSSTSAIEATTTKGRDGMDTGIIANNIIIPRGNHWGIQADGSITVQNNHISEAGVGLNLLNGVVATGNIVREAHSSAPGDRSVSVYDDVVFTGNSIEGKGVTVKVRGKNSIITNNILKYTGSWWALVIENKGLTDGGNIIKDNILQVPSTAAGRILYGNTKFPNGKNVVVDNITDTSGNPHQTYQELVLRASNDTHWAVKVNSAGELSVTQVQL